jgi:hypothetical protein
MADAGTLPHRDVLKPAQLHRRRRLQLTQTTPASHLLPLLLLPLLLGKQLLVAMGRQGHSFKLLLLLRAVTTPAATSRCLQHSSSVW